MRGARSQRTARTALVAVTLMALTLAGHAIGSGSIDVFGTAAVGVLALALAVAFTSVSGARLTWLPVLTVLLAGQAFLHLVLTFASDHGHTGSGVSFDALTMVMGHGIAAVIATALTLAADDLLRRWCAFLAAVIGTPIMTLAEPASGSSTAPDTCLPPGSTALLRHGVIRRGPPSALALTA